MLEKYEKKIKITKTNPGFILSISKKYKKQFDFEIESYLKVTFNYLEDRYKRLSFKILSQNNVYNLENGEWEGDKYRGYFIIIKSECAELNTIVTPEKYRNFGYATAILDITFEIISLYNEIIRKNEFPELKEYKQIKYLTGFISACDVGEKLSNEQLKVFYRKNGFLIENGNNIYHYFSY